MNDWSDTVIDELQARKARDADFDDLMAACDFAISATRNGEVRSSFFRMF